MHDLLRGAGNELLAKVFALLPGKELAHAEATCVHW